ncbi:hypothetical protein CQW23_16542 [Capsicum baccatum]|uniref:Uncharacterized protein n=1 Tax=Capsicum baccatum TaxID=33114 RepID=A0A2G2WBC0_CAPBA|nr:hypothetical protein CQW23_16542 [Capsicum baccatum]
MDVASDEEIERKSSGLLPSDLIDIIVDKDVVEAFSLEHELPSNKDSEDKRFSLLNQKLDEKKRGAEEGKNIEGHSGEKEEVAEERVTSLEPLNIEEMRQAKNHDFGGSKVDEDNIDETKNYGDINSIINNVISSVFAASSSLPTSPDVKNTQAERSDLGGINNDMTDVISDVDATPKFVNVDSITYVVGISIRSSFLFSLLPCGCFFYKF